MLEKTQKKGRIYRLYNQKLNLAYIGKTQQELDKRLAQHKNANTRKAKNKYNASSEELFKEGDVEIELLEEIDINCYDDKIKLTNLEKDYILKYKCVNKTLPFASTIPFIDDKKEYMRQYAKYNYRKNKEKILDYQRDYNSKNMDKIKAYQKQYRKMLKLKDSKL